MEDTECFLNKTEIISTLGLKSLLHLYPCAFALTLLTTPAHPSLACLSFCFLPFQNLGQLTPHLLREATSRFNTGYSLL